MSTDPADTSTIDDVIAYIESPEYLRMTAFAQGESPSALLSSSVTQPWSHDAATCSQEEASSLPLAPGCIARVQEDNPGGSPLVSGDLVFVMTEPWADAHWVDVQDRRGRRWPVPTTSIRASLVELAEWGSRALGFPQALDSPSTPATQSPRTPTSSAPVARPATRQRRRRAGSVTQLTTRDSFRAFQDAMDSCRSFKTYGSLRGTRFSDMRSPEAGYLSSALADRFRTAWIDGRVSYVVYSYNTPIAWTECGSDGHMEWVVPEVRYSTTTSRHQSKIRAAVSTSLLDAVRYLNEDGTTRECRSLTL